MALHALEVRQSWKRDVREIHLDDGPYVILRRLDRVAAVRHAFEHHRRQVTLTGLDDRRAGLELATPLRILNNSKRQPVLDRAT